MHEFKKEIDNTDRWIATDLSILRKQEIKDGKEDEMNNDYTYAKEIKKVYRGREVYFGVDYERKDNEIVTSIICEDKGRQYIDSGYEKSFKETGKKPQDMVNDFIKTYRTGEFSQDMFRVYLNEYISSKKKPEKDIMKWEIENDKYEIEFRYDFKDKEKTNLEAGIYNKETIEMEWQKVYEVNGDIKKNYDKYFRNIDMLVNKTMEEIKENKTKLNIEYNNIVEKLLNKNTVAYKEMFARPMKCLKSMEIYDTGDYRAARRDYVDFDNISKPGYKVSKQIQGGQQMLEIMRRNGKKDGNGVVLHNKTQFLIKEDFNEVDAALFVEQYEYSLKNGKKAEKTVKNEGKRSTGRK